MKKNTLIVLFICCILISGLIGFIAGINSSEMFSLNNTEKALIGTYRANSWNGKEAVIVLNKDKTAIHPFLKNCTWTIKGKNLCIEGEYERSILNEDWTEKTETVKSQSNILIVDNGLMLSSTFFQKIK